MAPREPQSAEDRLIARHFAPLAKHPGAFGLLDDAAVLTPPAGSEIVLTTDAVIGGVHFFPQDPPDLVARKALRVNLSDLAAKGAKPAGFLLSLAVPAGTGDDWLAAFAQGLGADAEAYACPLLGGDTVRSPGPVMISIAAFGALPHGSMVRRSGAKPGDHILVTGSIGDAALGLLLRSDAGRRWKLDTAEREYLAARFLLPQPRSAIAESVRSHASAAIDVSDGLAGDLAKLCAVSGASAEINVAQMPLSAATRKALAAEPSLLQTVLTGGDDYEILCTVPGENVAAFVAETIVAGIAVNEIGVVTSSQSAPQFLDPDRRPLALEKLSFSHF